jgi:hypothetical protein
MGYQLFPETTDTSELNGHQPVGTASKFVAQCVLDCKLLPFVKQNKEKQGNERGVI